MRLPVFRSASLNYWTASFQSRLINDLNTTSIISSSGLNSFFFLSPTANIFLKKIKGIKQKTQAEKSPSLPNQLWLISTLHSSSNGNCIWRLPSIAYPNLIKVKMDGGDGTLEGAWNGFPVVPVLCAFKWVCVLCAVMWILAWMSVLCLSALWCTQSKDHNLKKKEVSKREHRNEEEQWK